MPQHARLLHPPKRRHPRRRRLAPKLGQTPRPPPQLHQRTHRHLHHLGRSFTWPRRRKTRRTLPRPYAPPRPKLPRRHPRILRPHPPRHTKPPLLQPLLTPPHRRTTARIPPLHRPRRRRTHHRNEPRIRLVTSAIPKRTAQTNSQTARKSGAVLGGPGLATARVGAAATAAAPASSSFSPHATYPHPPSPHAADRNVLTLDTIDARFHAARLVLATRGKTASAAFGY